MSDNYGAWYKSFLNRDITPQEWSHWNDIYNQNKGDSNATLDQFLQSAEQERPRSSLTDHQRKVWDDSITALKAPTNTDFLTNLVGHTPTSYDEISPVLYDSFTDVDNLGKEGFDKKWRSVWDSGGLKGLSDALMGDSKNQALLEIQAANRKPNGSDTSFMSFLKEGLPIAAMPFLAGAAINGLGALGAASGGAATGGAAGAAGGAAAGSATGGLGGLWASLPSAAQSALTSMGIQGGMNVVTGKPLTQGLLQAGLMAGLGNVGSNFIGPYVGEGLSSLGFDPETVASLIKPVTTGAMATGTGLLRGQSFGDALLNGMQSGTISYAGDSLNKYLGNSGLSQPAQNILGSAGKGAISSAIRGKDPLAGIIGGAAQGAFNYGTGMLSSPTQPDVSAQSKDIMSGGPYEDDQYSVDGNDWLSKIENDYGDPYGFRNTDFTNYGNDNYEPYTMNDSYSDTFPDLLNGGSTPDTGNSALDAFLKQLGGSVGSAVGGAVSGGSGNSYMDKLMKQLQGLGDKAGQNPLAAIAAAMGAAGTLRNVISGPPNNLGAVDALMAKGAQQMNTPAVLPRGNIVAHDPRLYIQNYAADNSPTAAPVPQGPDYHGQLNTLYQSVLGRAPDAAGEQYWTQQMQQGMPIQQVLQNLTQSSEKNPAANAVMSGALGRIGGN